VNYLVPPWGHQLEAINRATSQRDFAFLMDMGTGKTATTINVLRHKYAEHKRVLRTLILCPVVVVENWRREFKTHSKIAHQVFPLVGSEKQRIKLFEEKSKLAVAPIFVTNYEALQMKGLLQRLLAWRPEVMVYDESQRIKNPQAIRTKMAIMLSDLAEHRYILSGTPVLNSPMDIWSQFRALDKGETFRDATNRPLNFYAFRNRYFVDKNAAMPAQKHFPKFELAHESVLAELNSLIYKKAIRVMKQECMTLPDLVRQTIQVVLAPEQKRLYDEMKTHFLAYLASGQAVTAQIAITKALRLQQIVSGYCKTEDGTEITLTHNPRLEALEELLRDKPPGEKIIIWATFHQNYRQIAEVLERLKIPYTELHGGVSGKDRQANIDRFQLDPACEAIIANQASGGVGVNLTAASISCFYSRNFSLEQDLQAEARNYRGGSEIHQKVTRYDLVAEGTIDELCLEALANKFNMAEEILKFKNRL
jgi:SNF2 family DNA or RNA helicase